MFDEIEQGIAEAVGRVLDREVTVKGWIVEVGFEDQAVRIGSGTVQQEFSALDDMARISNPDYADLGCRSSDRRVRVRAASTAVDDGEVGAVHPDRQVAGGLGHLRPRGGTDAE